MKTTAIICTALLLLPLPALSGEKLVIPPFLDDPLKSGKTVSTTAVAQMLEKQGASACIFPQEKKALTLQDVVERALCHNPQTRQAWAIAKVQAAQLGANRSLYLPNINGSVPLTWKKSERDGGIADHEQTLNTTLSLDYLLFSFGRKSSIEVFSESLKAANWGQNTTLQAVLLSAVTGYYQLFSIREAVEANKQAEAYSLENLKAATARFEVGVATLSDKLQASTAYSQAKFDRVRSEGNTRIALGNLANIMGLDADTVFDIAPPPIQKPDNIQDMDVKLLIDKAKKIRPDLLKAEAEVKAARANVKAVRGDALPKLSLLGSYNSIDSDSYPDTQGSTIGINASIPFFSGFKSYYLTQTAKAQLENQVAIHDQVNNQVSLDVWNSYYTLITEKEALKASNDLLASAIESEKVAKGRYNAGVGSILELLNAESSLSQARLQHIQSQYSWYIAKATLARAIGVLNLETIN